MTKPKAEVERMQKVEKVLLGLLRTPKTREGLVAAVSVKGSVSKHHVYGWLAQRKLDGTVTVLKSGHSVMYQAVQVVVNEKASASAYPSWLEPRALPFATGRIVVVDGEVVSINGESKTKTRKDEEDDEVTY